jgi:CheY-like chemotaxis protein
VTARTVLVVDDDDSIREIAEIALQLVGGLHVLTASGGVEALELTRKHLPDVVLMDVMMPDMDGYETMRQIRRVERFRKLPIIAITAKAMKGDREKCIEAGAWDYLSKPVDRVHMLSVLRGWLHR